jgi:hypothetical protein
MQSLPITTNAGSSNPTQARCYHTTLCWKFTMLPPYYLLFNVDIYNRELWYLTSLSTIFKLYRGGQFFFLMEAVKFCSFNTLIYPSKKYILTKAMNCQYVQYVSYSSMPIQAHDMNHFITSRAYSDCNVLKEQNLTGEKKTQITGNN